jgi:hypothetical protein
VLLGFAVPLTSATHQQTVENVGSQNHFAKPNRHVLTFLHPIFNL